MAKVTQSSVKYQHYPHQHRRCSQCTMFMPPDACTLVQGPISKHGYCIKFKPMDKAESWYGKEAK